MAILNELKEMLDRAKIPYEIYNHRTAFSAQEVASSLHDSGKEMAKAVILDVNGSLLMAVVPGDRRVSLKKIRALLGSINVAVAGEYEFAARFPGCEIGAMPPFGNLFGLPVYVDAALEAEEEIFFNAGNHRQAVKLLYKDFKQLARPTVAAITERRYRKAA